MTPAELVARCHDYAAQCWVFARKQENARDRLVLIDMAKTWLALANRMEGHESLPALRDMH
jgi:hypothetical protein